MGIRSLCRSLGPALVVAAAMLLVLPAAGRAAGPPSAAQRLADEYSPITMLRKRVDPPCDTTGEQYEPTTVRTVLGNPTVTLERDRPGFRRPEPVLKAPTVKDIAGLGKEYYLNLTGQPLGETCVYARDFLKLKQDGKAPAVTYAHIAREPGHLGFALQYWFFWYFNEFNDLHEGDWEGMQITFDAATPEAALQQEPSEIVVFQHAGGELADWDDAKVEKAGSHPIVYPAAGSHATFYSPAVFVGNGGQGSGLGCDNTSEPLNEVRPRPVLLPDQVPFTGPFAWLSYDGRWGQKAAGYNNGPAGPATKTVWKEPFTWMDGQRDASARLPGGTVIGPAVTEAFCSAVAAVSGLVNANQESSAGTIIFISVLLVALIAFIGITRWRPVDIDHLRERRAFGQLIRAARQLYGRHWKAMIAIAVTAIPVIGGAQYLSGLLGTKANGATVAVGDLLDTFSRPVAGAIVLGVVIVYVRELVETGEASFVDAWRGMFRRFWRVVATQLLATLGPILMAITIIGLPFAIWKLVGWAFVQQEVLFSDKPIRQAFRGSTNLVRGRWFHTLRVVLFLYLLIVVTGPIFTFALIFTSIPLVWINLIGSLIYALLIPYVGLGYTLLYFDLQARAKTEPAKPYRSWRPWRPRQFGRVVPEPEAAPSG